MVHKMQIRWKYFNISIQLLLDSYKFLQPLELTSKDIRLKLELFFFACYIKAEIYSH